MMTDSDSISLAHLEILFSMKVALYMSLPISAPRYSVPSVAILTPDPEKSLVASSR